jgi:hypothetical protein
MERPSTFNLSHSQRELIDNAFELRRDNLRRRWKEELRQQIKEAKSLSELERLWSKTRQEMIAGRPYLGRDLERQAARLFDARQAQLTR